MTLQEYYTNVGGEYSEIIERLYTDERIIKYLNLFFSGDDLTLLQNAWNDQNGEKIFQISHRIKGGAINIELKSIYSYASQLTEAYRNGNIPDKNLAQELYINICSEYTKAKSLLSKIG